MNVKDWPVSKKRIEELNLDPASTPSCARPIKGQVVGCKVWDKCKLKERAQGIGPVMKGVQIVKKSPMTGAASLKNDVDRCFNIPQVAERIEAQGGVLRVVAGEGDTIKLVGSKADIINDPVDGMRKIVSDHIYDFKIPAYDEIEDQTALVKKELAKATLEQSRVALDDERVQEMIEDASGSVPRGSRKAHR